MRIYDNATPEGRYVGVGGSYRDARQDQTSYAPPCPTCGRDMKLNPALLDTPDYLMHPQQPNWEDVTRQRLEYLRKQVAKIKSEGHSPYECSACS